MSAWLASQLLDPQKLIADLPDWYVAAITVGQATNLGLRVVSSPQHGEGHYEIVGEKTKRIQSVLAKGATWVIGPQR